MVHRSLLQWTREERVPLSLYERASVAVLHFHFLTASYYCISQTPGKIRRFLIFPNNHRRQSKVFFIFTIRPSISSLSQRPTGHESPPFACQCRVKILVYSSALQCKKVLTIFYRKVLLVERITKISKFFFESKQKSSAWKHQLISTCFFVS